jgi:electron transport complex protein RnfD
VAIIFVKQLFGGLGRNFANPAITARVVMFLAFSTSMTTWAPIPADAVTSATPLMLIKRGDLDILPGLRDMFLGVHGGSLGETSALLILIGGAYLLIRRVITWHAPVTFILTVFAFTAHLGVELSAYHLLGGGLFLGAFFMATDYPTTPQTGPGRILFGFGCGVLTVLIRFFGNYPEGVAFSILFMNMLVPYINRLTLKRALGGKKD